MQVVASVSSDLEALFWLIGAVIGVVPWVALYLLPTILAVRRRVPGVLWIALINVLLGWLVVGWVVALVLVLRRSHAPADGPF